MFGGIRQKEKGNFNLLKKSIIRLIGTNYNKKGTKSAFFIFNRYLYIMEHIVELLLTTALPTIIGFVVGHYKRNRDNEALYIQNLNAAMEAYNRLFEDLTKRYDEEIVQLTKKLDLYEQTIEELKHKIRELENDRDIL